MMEKFKILLEEFDELNISKGDYVIFGSGPIAVRGIKDVNDLDVLVLPEKFEELKEKYKQDTSKHPFGCIEIGDIEIGESWQGDKEKVKEWIEAAEEYEGHMYMPLENVLEWKKKMGRPKDLKDVELVEKWLDKL